MGEARYVRAARGDGFVYFSPDVGTEYAKQHPVKSGETPDATDVRASTDFEDELVRQLGTEKSEYAWVIEHGASEVSKPRYWGGVHGWTYENLQAVRFAREVDAQSVAESMDDGFPGNYRLAEHAWVPTNNGHRAGCSLSDIPYLYASCGCMHGDHP